MKRRGPRDLAAVLVVLLVLALVAWLATRFRHPTPPENSSCPAPVELCGPGGRTVLWCDGSPEQLAERLTDLGLPECIDPLLARRAEFPPPHHLILRTDCLVETSRPALSGPGSLALGLPLDLNLATAEDLVVLPGLGPTLARRIIDDRAAHGPFCSPADLARVKGIGEKRVAAWSPQVIARCPQTSGNED